MRTKLLFTIILFLGSISMNANNDNKLIAGHWKYEQVKADVECNRSNVTNLIENQLIKEYKDDIDTDHMSIVFHSNGRYEYLENDNIIAIGTYAYSAKDQMCTITTDGETEKIRVVVMNNKLLFYSPSDEAKYYNNPDVLESMFNLENASKVQVTRANIIIILTRSK